MRGESVLLADTAMAAANASTADWSARDNKRELVGRQGVSWYVFRLFTNLYHSFLTSAASDSYGWIVFSKFRIRLLLFPVSARRMSPGMSHTAGILASRHPSAVTSWKEGPASPTTTSKSDSDSETSAWAVGVLNPHGSRSLQGFAQGTRLSKSDRTSGVRHHAVQDLLDLGHVAGRDAGYASDVFPHISAPDVRQI